MSKQIIKLYRYEKRFGKLFRKEKTLIRKALKGLGNFKIYHIGSSSVPGLGGKGIIDIMIALKDWKKRQEYVAFLKRIGFGHIHPEHKDRIFLSRVKRTKKGDTHLHLVRAGTREMLRHLVFRDYLRGSKKARERYWAHKMESYKQTGGVRDAFGKLKGVMVDKMEREAFKRLKRQSTR